MSVNSHKAKNLKPEQERMRAAVARLQKYMATYDQQPMYLDYQDKTFIDDVLYGLGTALSLDYQYAGGFEKFKDFLRKHLEQPHGPYSPPKGWLLLPDSATVAMHNAAALGGLYAPPAFYVDDEGYQRVRTHCPDWSRVYRVMVDAAPPLPQSDATSCSGGTDGK